MLLQQQLRATPLKSTSSFALPPRCAVSRRAIKSVRRYGKLVALASSTGVEENKRMREAESRWEGAVRDGKVKSVGCKDLEEMINAGWIVLDARPTPEVERVAVKGAVHVPLFLPDPANDVGALLKKATAFGMGGWWLGGTHMIPNEKFMSEVQAKIPKDAKVVVACQKGLRSLAACEQLSRAGYSTLAWINGGFDVAKKGEVPTVNGQDIRYAGIGGLSEALGWTEVQQEEKSGFLGGIYGVIKIAIVVVVLDGLLFAYEQFNYMQSVSK